MALIAMMLSPEERIKRLQVAVKRLGGKAPLGRALGYRDGAFVGQMLRGERPITEKTIQALVEIRGLADLFVFRADKGGFAIAANDDPGPQPEALSPALVMNYLAQLLDGMSEVTRPAAVAALHRFADGQATASSTAALLELLAKGASFETDEVVAAPLPKS